MGGFPFGGGYFGLYALGASVPPTPTPVQPFFGGAHQVHRVLERILASADLVLPELEFSARGIFVFPNTGRVSLDLSALVFTSNGIVRRVVLSELDASLQALNMDAHTFAQGIGEAKEQRLMKAFRQLSTSNQAKVLRRVEGFLADAEEDELDIFDQLTRN